MGRSETPLSKRPAVQSAGAGQVLAVTTPLLALLVVNSVVTLCSLIWVISSRRRSPEGRRRGFQAGAIAAALVVVGLVLSRLL